MSPVQVRSVVLPVIKKLSTGEPCLIPHVGAHPRPWKNVSPPTAGVSGAARHSTAWHGGKKKEGVRERVKRMRRMASAAVSRRSKTTRSLRGVFFLHTIGIRAARSLSLPAFQRFPTFFFSIQAS